MTGTWKEAYRDPNLVMLMDTEDEVIACCMYTFQGGDKQWAALDADGNVIGYARSLGAAKDLVK